MPDLDDLLLSKPKDDEASRHQPPEGARMLGLLFSFFCLVAYENYRAIEANLSAGCEQFAVWRNAWDDPVWRFFHCPDAARPHVQADAMVVRTHAPR